MEILKDIHPDLYAKAKKAMKENDVAQSVVDSYDKGVFSTREIRDMIRDYITLRDIAKDIIDFDTKGSPTAVVLAMALNNLSFMPMKIEGFIVKNIDNPAKA